MVNSNKFCGRAVKAMIIKNLCKETYIKDGNE